MSETTNIVDSPEAQAAFLADVPVATDKVATPVKEQALTDKAYSETDLQRVREQEKSKLYPQIDSLKEELNVLKKEREERLLKQQLVQQKQKQKPRKRLKQRWMFVSYLKQKN
jgi:hypothetical protein